MNAIGKVSKVVKLIKQAQLEAIKEERKFEKRIVKLQTKKDAVVEAGRIAKKFAQLIK